MDPAKYTIDQLVEMSGFSRRAIRYYIQENLLAPPAGRGRGGFYNDSHLAHLQRIRSLRSQGLSLMAIKRLTESVDTEQVLYPREVWAKYDIAPGMEINVRRDVEASSARKLNDIIRIAISIMKEETEDEHS